MRIRGMRIQDTSSLPRLEASTDHAHLAIMADHRRTMAIRQHLSMDMNFAQLPRLFHRHRRTAASITTGMAPSVLTRAASHLTLARVGRNIELRCGQTSRREIVTLRRVQLSFLNPCWLPLECYLVAVTEPL